MTETAGALESLERVGVKFYWAAGQDVPLVEFIPVFHSWIQRDAVDGILIDVADYSHVPEGPGIILVAHEALYAIDESDGRRGLAVSRRRPHGAGFDASLRWVLVACAKAARLLEEELGGRVRIGTEHLQFFAYDRLLAPNTPQIVRSLRSRLDPWLSRLYGDVNLDLSYERDPREPPRIYVRAARGPTLSEMLAAIQTE